jgi:Arc/MetJ-type ribon-helix-helix transcriptional regulator
MHDIVVGGKNKVKLVTVLLPEAYLEGLDELVRANMYPSRSSVIRSSVRDLLKKELWENKRNR